MTEPENKQFNQASLWICWTVLCLGLGYAWASGSYLKRIGKLESLITNYQTSQITQAIDMSRVPADKRINPRIKPKNW